MPIEKVHISKDIIIYCKEKMKRKYSNVNSDLKVFGNAKEQKS